MAVFYKSESQIKMSKSFHYLIILPILDSHSRILLLDFPRIDAELLPVGALCNIIIPISVNRTRIIFQGFVGDLAMLGKGAGGDLDKVEAEDQEIVEALTRESPLDYIIEEGIPPLREVVHHFHMMLTEHTT